MACRRDLATAELLAARFYQDDRGVCEGAVARYQEVLVDYPDFEAEEEVLSRLARCLVALGRPGEAAIYRARLKRDHPEGGPASGRGGPPPEAEPPPVRLASLRPAPPPPAPPPAVEPPPPPPAREEAPLPELTQAEVDRRGIALLNAGSFAEAIEHYRRALAHYPALASRLSNLVAIYTRSGHYEIAYCLAPDDPATRLAWEEHARPRSGLCAETR